MSTRRILTQMIDPPRGLGLAVEMLSRLSLVAAGVIMLIMFQMILYALVMTWLVKAPTVLTPSLLPYAIGYALLLIAADTLRRGHLIRVDGGPLGGRRLEFALLIVALIAGLALIASALTGHADGMLPVLPLAFPVAGVAILLATCVRFGRLKADIRAERSATLRGALGGA